MRTNDPGEVRIRRRLEPPSATRQTELTADESAGSGTNPRSTILVSIDYAELVKGQEPARGSEAVLPVSVRVDPDELSPASSTWCARRTSSAELTMWIGTRRFTR